MVDKPPCHPDPDLAGQVARSRNQVRRDAVQAVIDSVESYQAELPQSGAGHDGRLRERWEELEHAVICAAEFLQTQPITPEDLERQKRLNTLTW